MRLWDLFGGRSPNGSDPLPAVRSDERRSVRGKVQGTGVVGWVEDERCYSSPVRFEDASHSGAGIVMPIAVPVGQTVWLLLRDGADYRAVTRYCRQDKNGFRVGVRTIPEKRNTVASPDPATGFTLKWIDSWQNLRTSPVSVVRDNGAANDNGAEMVVVGERPVPCPSIVLLTGSEDLCLAYGSSCPRRAPYRVRIRILPDAYVKY